MFCYVLADGSHGTANHMPDGALQITEDVYTMLEENPGLLDVKVEGKLVHITPSLISYKRKAVDVVQMHAATTCPDASRVQRLHWAVTAKQGCFDTVSGLFLSYEEVVGNFEELVAISNEVAFLESRYVQRINASEDLYEVDHHLEVFQAAIQKV